MDKQILILYKEVMGYTLAGLSAFSKENPDISVQVIGRDIERKNPYTLSKDIRFNYKSVESFADGYEMLNFCKKLNPTIVLVNGWEVRDYMRIARYFFKKNIPTVCLYDNQWLGTAKQWGAVLTSQFYIKRYFTYMWGSGLRQYEFGRRLGFKKENIFSGLYTCDFPLFNSVERTWHKNILFVGRFIPKKGIDILLDAFRELSNIYPEWTLTLVGAGDVSRFSNIDKVTIKEFKQPEELCLEFANASIFCLPSKFEPWGVVVHEAASAGLPIICSSACGAGDTFVVNNYNGYIFDDNDRCLKDCLRDIMQKEMKEIRVMGDRSREIANNFSPEIWASTLLTILNKN